MEPLRVLVEVLDGHGRARRLERLVLDADRPRFTVGRGAAADVVVDDPHVAALHAEVEIGSGGEVRVTDLGTLNGIQAGAQFSARFDGQRVRGGALDLPDAHFSLGRTRIHVRTAHEVLPPEVPEGEGSIGAAPASWLAPVSALIYFGYVFYTVWIGAPRDLVSVAASGLISAVFVAGAWIAAWGFVTRVIRGEWHWGLHATIFFTIIAAVIIVDWIVDVLWYAFALPSSPAHESPLVLIAAALALYWHLRGAAHISARRAALVSVLMPLLAGGGLYLVNALNQSRNVNHIGVEAKLLPPSLRLRNGPSVDAYFAGAQKLKEETDRKRRTMPTEGSEEED